MKIHRQLQQGSLDWFKVREGRMTASHAQAIATAGKGLDTYIDELMAEKFSVDSDKYKKGYTNQDIERGNELEPIARQMYELRTGNIVEEVGFVEFDEYTGCSPDGLTEVGGIEIKCPSDKVYFKFLRTRKIDTKYMWQIQMNMFITKKKSWDYIVYNPNFRRSMEILTVDIEEKAQEKLKKGIAEGVKKIKDLNNFYINLLQN